MPHWYWEKKELWSTPSQSKGMEYDTETRYRRIGASFISQLGKTLGLSHSTMASGSIYFHRFYMFHAFQDFPKYVVATCCLFLAGKAEETPKKCRDVIRAVRTLINNDKEKLFDEKQMATFGADPREEVMVLERVLLQTIKFDLQVDHPYSSLIQYAKCLKGDTTKLQKVVQMAWTFVNDSLCTTLSLQWEPEIIAIALVYLAAKLKKFEIVDWKNRKPMDKHWWDQYVEDLDTEVIEDICHHILDLYAADNAHSPQPQSASGSNTPKRVAPPPAAARSAPPPPSASSSSSVPPPVHPHPATPSRAPQPPPLPPSGPPPPPPSGGGHIIPISGGTLGAPPIIQQPPPPQPPKVLSVPPPLPSAGGTLGYPTHAAAQPALVVPGQAIPYAHAAPPPGYPPVVAAPPPTQGFHHYPPPSGEAPPGPPPLPQGGIQQPPPSLYYSQPPPGQTGYHRGGGRY